MLGSVLQGDNPCRDVYLFIHFPCREKPGGFSLAVRLCLETTETDQHARWVKRSMAMGGASLKHKLLVFVGVEKRPAWKSQSVHRN